MGETVGLQGETHGVDAASQMFQTSGSGGEQTRWEERPLGDSITEDTGDDSGSAGQEGGESNPLLRALGITGDQSGAAENAGKPAAGESGTPPAGSPATEALVQLAREWGFTDDQIKAFPNAELLQTAIGGIAARFKPGESGQGGGSNGQAGTGANGNGQAGQGASGGGQPDIVGIFSAIKPDSIMLDTSKIAAFQGLTDEAQGVFVELNKHFASMVHDLGSLAAREISQLRQTVRLLAGQQDHGILRTVLGGISDEDLKPVIGSYLDFNGDAVKKLESIRQMVAAMPDNVPMTARVRTVLMGLHADEVRKAADTRRAEALRKNQTKLGAHAVGPASTRRTATAGRGRSDQVGDVKGILQKHGCL